MKRDPFYCDIWNALEQPLDPDDFERCACDLLRTEFPSLVPVRGGSDSGMDGAIADGEGPAFPLVCTTSPDVIGNLRKSLNPYLKSGGTRRKAVVATSRVLTPRQRQNLVKRGAELEFDIVQVYDRAAFADRLYESPGWCLELLNLTGDARVLSAEPLTSRPFLQNALIGRDAERAWLRETSGDRLLVGHPGSGKTSLLYSMTQEGRGLFLVGKDLAKVAPEIRKNCPGAVMLDDAHVDIELLRVFSSYVGSSRQTSRSWQVHGPGTRRASPRRSDSPRFASGSSAAWSVIRLSKYCTPSVCWDPRS